MKSLLNGIGWILVLVGIATLCAFFPRFLTVVEVMMRELRAVWWILGLFILFCYLQQKFRRR